MEVFQLQAVIAVVESGSFTKAAESLYSSPQTVKNQIDALERELGRRLFLRSPQGALVTEEGKYFCEKARKIIEDLEQMSLGVRAFGTAEGVIVACPRGSEQPIRDSICSDFVALHPDITLRYEVCSEGQSVIECVRSHKANVAFSCVEEDDESLVGLTLQVCPSIPASEFYVVMPKDDPLANRGRIAVRDLTSKSPILTYRGNDYLPAELKPLVSMQHNFTDTYEIVNYCLDGGTFIDNTYMPIVHKGLARVPLDLPPVMMDVICRTDPSSPVAAFVQHCVAWKPNNAVPK